MSYHSNKKRVEGLLELIKTKVERRTGVIRTFKQFLKEDVNVWVYTEMPKEVKKNYDEYLEQSKWDVNEHRGCCFTNQYIRAKKMSQKKINSRMDIVLHGIYETEESLAWILLHEFMHAMIKSDMCKKGFDWLPSAIHSMSWIWQDRVEKLNPGVSHHDYYRTDEGHESDPEEQLCNLYATSIMGENYDRYWWRENMAPNKNKEEDSNGGI